MSADLAEVFDPGHAASRWQHCTHHFAEYADKIRPHAPAATSKRLGSYQPFTVGNLNVLLIKSELHLNQDASRPATAPLRQVVLQVKIDEQHAEPDGPKGRLIIRAVASTVPDPP